MSVDLHVLCYIMHALNIILPSKRPTRVVETYQTFRRITFVFILLKQNTP